MAALTIRNVSKTFGSLDVLKNVDLEIENGEFTVLVGPSGCGKSTLLSIIAGLDNAYDGTVQIGGRQMKGVPAKDRDIAMVFQTYALYPAMTVRQNVTFGMECRRIPKAAQDEAVARVSRLLQIEHLLNRKPSALSGGQRQRVAMGRALVRNPLLFLFDEPLSNLDAQLRVEMRMEIKRLHERVASTMIYVTHDQIEAMTLASRIAVMRHGVVQQFADPDTIYNAPANLFVARFIGAPPMNTVPALLIKDEGRLTAVIGKDTPNPLHIPIHAVPQSADGYLDQEVILGVRPECICEPTRWPGDLPETAVKIDAFVEMTEPTGSETIVVLRLGGHEALGRVSPDLKLKSGANAQFIVDTRKICLFDAKSEMRIN